MIYPQVVQSSTIQNDARIAIDSFLLLLLFSIPRGKKTRQIHRNGSMEGESYALYINDEWVKLRAYWLHKTPNRVGTLSLGLLYPQWRCAINFFSPCFHWTIFIVLIFIVSFATLSPWLASFFHQRSILDSTTRLHPRWRDTTDQWSVPEGENETVLMK